MKDKFFVFKEKKDEFKQLKLKKKELIILISILISLIVINISLVTGISTKEEIIGDFKVAIEENDVKLLSKILKVNEKKVNYEELLPLMNYYQNKKDTLNNVIKELRGNNTSGILTIESKKRLFGKRYYLNIKRISVEVKSNFPQTEITINNKKVKSGEMVKDFIPGNYVANYKLETEFGAVTGEKEITISDEEYVDIDVDAGNITLYSDYKDADVIINGKKIEKKVEDVVDFGPIPLNRNIELYIEKEFPWGIIKSETMYINNGGTIKINIDMLNQTLVDEVDLLLNKFFNSVFNALNEEDKTLIQYTDEITKNKIYDDIFKKTLFFTNNYKISDMNLNIEKSDFKYENSIYKGNVVVKINYDIYKKLLPFIKENREEMFLVNLEYVNNTWNVTGVQRFNMYEE